jgi:Resolvase, N terminal domain
MPRTAVAYLRPHGELDLELGPPRKLTIVATYVDQADDERPALAAALESIASGQADTLYVQRLGAVARSPGELVRLIDWLADADATLLAGDVALDTRGSAGARSVALLREIERWSREPADRRRRPGRPGLAAGSPELAELIGALRERGLSLLAIAERLNADRVPTPRGGTTWRPSSVQAALGYRRPRPPAPGVPPPRKPKHKGKAPPGPEAGRKRHPPHGPKPGRHRP